jgi:hypothetical protein
MKPLIPGTALPSFLTSLIPFLLTPLIFSLAFPLNPLISHPCYALGHISLTTLLSSIPIALTETPQSFGSWPGPIRLTPIPWSTLPFATNVSVLLTTPMVVTNELSSYLLILSFISMDLLLVLWTQSVTLSSQSSKSKVPQVNPAIRPPCDPEKQGTRTKPSCDLVLHSEPTPTFSHTAPSIYTPSYETPDT